MSSDDHTKNSYDRVPYTSLPFQLTLPDRLATLATLFSVTPPALDSCRVLELGCAAGGNLIPMAVAMPTDQLRCSGGSSRLSIYPGAMALHRMS